MSCVLLLQLAAVIARTVGKRVLYLALPLYFTVAIVAFVLFAGNGLDASYVTAHAFDAMPLRLSLLAGWGMLTLPLARLVLGDAQLFFLRVLPIPRWWLLGIACLGHAAVQLAWAVLWLRGGGLVAGACALLAVLGLQSHVVASVRDWRDCLALTALAAGWGLAPTPLALALLLPGSLYAHRKAWLRAPEPRAAGRHWVCAANAWLATATALGAAACRSSASALARAGALAALGYGGIALGVRHNPDWTEVVATQVGLAIWGAACLLSAVTLARPLLQAETELTMVFDACGTPVALRALSAIGLLAGAGALIGGAAGGSLGASAATTQGSDWALLFGLTTSAWAALAAAAVRMLTRQSGRDSGHQLLAFLGLYGAAIAVLMLSPRGMVLFLLLTAAAMGGRATRFGAVLAAREG